MKRLFTILAAMLVLTGCVSTGTYQETVDVSQARQQRIEKLSEELDAAKNANEALSAAKKKETDELKERLSALEADIERLTAANSEQAGQTEALREEISNRTGEAASLREKIANREKEIEYLRRENERLQVKAGEISSQKEKEIANVKTTYDNLVKELKQEIEKGDIKITQAVDRLSVNLVEKILFDSGKAEIKPEGLKVLKRVGDVLKKSEDRQIRVEGHTDNVRIGPRIQSKYPTNWELSTTRATTVVRYLEDKAGLNPTLLSAAGFSEYRPVESNASAEGRAQNRRIEIVLLPLDVDRVLEELKN